MTVTIRYRLFYADSVGHVYAIGDCGGATHTAQCPECKATIGGTGHAPAAGNRLAREMDHAETAAWPGMNVNG